METAAVDQHPLSLMQAQAAFAHPHRHRAPGCQDILKIIVPVPGDIKAGQILLVGRQREPGCAMLRKLPSLLGGANLAILCQCHKSSPLLLVSFAYKPVLS